MFDEESFTRWLNQSAEKAMQKVTSGQSLNTDEIIILTLKAQTNHIIHLEQDLSNDITTLRQDMERRFEQMDKRFEAIQLQMDKRFEAIQLQMDKRFEGMDKRFVGMERRLDRFMYWSFGLTIAASSVIIAAIKWL